MRNDPELWAAHVPRRAAESHKYANGSVLVVSGPEFATGASRLSAMAALNAGAGAVTLCGAPEALRVHAAHVTSIMLREANSVADFARLLALGRYDALVLGPAAGLGEATRQRIEALLAASIPAVLDADALTVLVGDLPTLASRLHATPLVLTPHHGEFQRLFGAELAKDPIFPALAPDLQATTIEQARAAARLSNSVIVYKGHHTVIANPDGHAAINTHAGPELATAGSGDVLTGIIASHLAQGMPAFEAAASGVWLHAHCGALFGIGLTADRLVPLVRPLVAFLPPR